MYKQLLLQYLVDSYEGLLYVGAGVLTSYGVHRLFQIINNRTKNDDQKTTMRLLLEIWLQIFVIINAVIFVKYVVSNFPSPFSRLNIKASHTGAVLLAFSILLYLDDFKSKIKLFVSNLKNDTNIIAEKTIDVDISNIINNN